MSHRYRVIDGAREVTADTGADGYVTIDGQRFLVEATSAGQYRVTAEDGVKTTVAVAGPPHDLWAVSGGRARQLVVDGAPRRATSTSTAASDMTAPMPATVVTVAVAIGDLVKAGDPVVVLEAMKMELTVRAARDGVVRAIGCRVGDLVTPGMRLAEIGE